MDVIFDIDGTLLDISHRLHLIGVSESTAPSERAHPTNSKRWKEFRDSKLKEHDKLSVLLLRWQKHFCKMAIV